MARRGASGLVAWRPETLRSTLTLDAEGGDNAPAEIVAGALMAASPTLKVLLVGRPAVLEPHLDGADRRYVEIVPSASVIGFEYGARGGRQEHAGLVDRGGAQDRGGRSSQGFISAGNTGAMLAGGSAGRKRAWRASEGRRSSTILPGLQGPVVFLDSGANADCRPENLVEFGVLGAAFARTVLGTPEPKVGLLNIGEEESKGSELAQAAYQLPQGLGAGFRGQRRRSRSSAQHGRRGGDGRFHRQRGAQAAGGVFVDPLHPGQGGCATAAHARRSGAAAEAGLAQAARGIRPGGVRRHLSAGRQRSGGDLPRQLPPARPSPMPCVSVPTRSEGAC